MRRSSTASSFFIWSSPARGRSASLRYCGKGGAERRAFVIARSQRVRPEVAGPMVNSATKQSNSSAKTGLLPFRQEESRGRGDALHFSPPRGERSRERSDPGEGGITAGLSDAGKRQRCRYFPNC